MSKIALASDPSGTGTFTIASPNSNTNRTLTLPDATGTLFSSADVASQAEAEAGTGTGLMTSERVEQHTIANDLGWGQTWQDVSASRTAGTSYQNTTGRPIVVNIDPSSATAGTFQVSVNNSTWIRLGIIILTSQDIRQGSWVVPPNWYYRLTAGAGTWTELR
jgi:hypothetical protein